MVAVPCDGEALEACYWILGVLRISHSEKTSGNAEESLANFPKLAECSWLGHSWLGELQS